MTSPAAALRGGMKENEMNANLRKSYRYTRHLAHAYRASMARQEIAPQQWREDGLMELSRKLHSTLDWWAAQELAHVYNQAIK